MRSVPIVGVGVVVWYGDRVLLIRRSKPPRVGQWSLPGGQQECGETVEAAVRRELREETAVTCGPLKLVDVVDLIDRDAEGRLVQHYTLIDYTADALHDMVVAGSDAADVAWWSPADLAQLTLWEATREVIRSAEVLRRSSRLSSSKN